MKEQGNERYGFCRRREWLRWRLEGIDIAGDKDGHKGAMGLLLPLSAGRRGLDMALVVTVVAEVDGESCKAGYFPTVVKDDDMKAGLRLEHR